MTLTASAAADYTFSGWGWDAPNSLECYGTGSCTVLVYLAVGVYAGFDQPYATAGIISTVAGNGCCGFAGNILSDGELAASTGFAPPYGVFVDGQGNIYVAATSDDKIVKVSPSTNLMTIVAGTSGGQSYNGDGIAATLADLYAPEAGAVDSAGNIFISDGGNCRIRKVTASTGLISTVAGNGTCGYAGDSGLATNAEIYDPEGIALDSAANIYIADSSNSRIRVVNTGTNAITLAGVTIQPGYIATVAGTGTAGYNGDNIAATSAELGGPQDVSLDSAGHIFIADTGNERVRVVNTGTTSVTIAGVTIAAGYIGTVAGNGTAGYNGDSIAATAAELNFPSAVAVDSAGNIYIADSSNNRVREVSASTNKISTIAGTGNTAVEFSGDGGPATAASLRFSGVLPGQIAVDSSANVYFPDVNNARIRVIGGANAATISYISPAAAQIGGTVKIVGTNLGSSNGTVTFNGTKATSIGSWGPTSISVTVPAGATTGNVIVTSSTGYASNPFPFTIGLLPIITSLSATSGVPGQSITITGSDFGSTPGVISFNGAAASVISWNPTTIQTSVPSGATSGNVGVVVSGVASNGMPFTVGPVITSVSPNPGLPNTTQINITGYNFGSSTGVASFNGTAMTTTLWGPTSVTANLPSSGTAGTITVTANSLTSNALSYSLITTPTIISLSPVSGWYGTSITITGANFGSSQGTITFNGIPATPISWSTSAIVAAVPGGATTGNVVVTASGQLSNGAPFVVQPFVQSNFAALPIDSSVSTATVSYTGPQNTGDLNVVAVGWVGPQGSAVSSVTDSMNNTYTGVTSSVTFYPPTSPSSSKYTVIYYAPNIRSAAPNQNVVTVRFNEAVDPDVRIAEYAGVNAASPVDVVATGIGDGTIDGVPETNSGPVATTNAFDLLVAADSGGVTDVGAGDGYTNRVAGNPHDEMLEDQLVDATSTYYATTDGFTGGAWVMQMVAFRMGTSGGTGPSIVELAPASGMPATSVNITGVNFGSTTGTVKFNGTSATPISWAPNLIKVNVPPSATTGNVVVTASNVASNGVSFTVQPFVQGNDNAEPTTTPTSGTTVAVPYTAPQTAGDLNVVAIGWPDTSATITSVTDSLGNTYSLAVGPTVQSNPPAQAAIYYAPNIRAAGAGANSVSVTFSLSEVPDIRIAEYSGLSTTSPLDVSAASYASGTLCDSGFATTTNANDILIGANYAIEDATGAGVGYTSRVDSVVPALSPGSFFSPGRILEDQLATAMGKYDATVPLADSNMCIMQMVAFRAGSGGWGTTPIIRSLSQPSGPVGTAVTIYGTNFGASQGSSTVKFNGTAASATWSNAQIQATVPAGATTGNVVVTVSGTPSNGIPFTVLPTPVVSTLSPSSGPVQSSVVISGSNFGSGQGGTVGFSGGVSGTASLWDSNSIVVQVPPGAVTGPVTVTVNDISGTGPTFTVTSGATPSISGASPNPANVGTQVTINGSGFGATPGLVWLGTRPASIVSWSDTQVVAAVSSGAKSGSAQIFQNGVWSNAVSFTVSVVCN